MPFINHTINFQDPFIIIIILLQVCSLFLDKPFIVGRSHHLKPCKLTIYLLLIYFLPSRNKKFRIKIRAHHILVVLNLDLPGIGVCDLRESFPREINGPCAPCRTVINYLNHDGAPAARLRYTLVCGAGAPDSERFVANCTVVPEDIACSGDHGSIIFKSVACRGYIIYSSKEN